MKYLKSSFGGCLAVQIILYFCCMEKSCWEVLRLCFISVWNESHACTVESGEVVYCVINTHWCFEVLILDRELIVWFIPLYSLLMAFLSLTGSMKQVNTLIDWHKCVWVVALNQWPDAEWLLLNRKWVSVATCKKKKVYKDIETINNEKLCIFINVRCVDLVERMPYPGIAIFKKLCKIKMLDIMQMVRNWCPLCSQVHAKLTVQKHQITSWSREQSAHFTLKHAALTDYILS